MQGVEILASAQVATEWANNWTAFWIVAIIVFGIFLFMGIDVYLVSYNVGDIVSSCIFGIILGALGGVLIGYCLLGTPISHETQYKVTISEEVSMTEFYEHYEVIEQDGKIFTVREKTNEK